MGSLILIVFPCILCEILIQVFFKSRTHVDINAIPDSLHLFVNSFLKNGYKRKIFPNSSEEHKHQKQKTQQNQNYGAVSNVFSFFWFCNVFFWLF